MMQFKTGNLLESSSQALVNTVNCEGIMGKGIAYQFKLRFPEMFRDYQQTCKRHELIIGKLHTFEETGKTIINFPTKTTWREKSKISYIDAGLNALHQHITENDITSVAIPPLGSGNGGLNWTDVRDLICQKLDDLCRSVDIEIYEPSGHYVVARPVAEPQLPLSALVLMQIKLLLNEDKFTNIGLQKTAYFFNFFYRKEYFHFAKDKYGPYDDAIRIIGTQIKIFQQYHNVDTEKAYDILFHKLISKNVETKLLEMSPAIVKATEFSNSLKSIHDLEGIATVLYLIQNHEFHDDEQVVTAFQNWSEDKARRFPVNQIEGYIAYLIENHIIQSGLLGYTVCDDV